jgi:hypothetical protein
MEIKRAPIFGQGIEDDKQLSSFALEATHAVVLHILHSKEGKPLFHV